MSALVPTVSPFERIRREDADGEYWAGRELMPVMGYGADWRNFADAIGRAKAACKNTGEPVSRHFGDVTEKGTGGRPRVDVRLTRYAAYLVAMNGDPRKKEIAAAQTYFAVKTREAELHGEQESALQQQVPTTLVEALRMAADSLERAELAEAKVAEQGLELLSARPKAAYVDAFIDPRDDVMTIGDFAKQLGLRPQQLRDYLVARKVIYRKNMGARWSGSKGKDEPIYEWRACAGYEQLFSPRRHHDVERLYNGQVASTLYVNPVGMVQIREMLEKWPIEGSGRNGNVRELPVRRRKNGGAA